ncbi:MAG: SoxR reducing system RseC family protein [Clostridiales bacterium]|nr:SoxR reducing system RseC family protein [Clostridiales bacterium]
MQQIGTVERTDGEYAEVRIKRQSACGGNCAGCGGCGGREQVVKARNKAGAKVGDTVALEMDSGKVIGAAAAVYIVPLGVLAAAFMVFNRKMGEGSSILASLAVMALLYVFIALASRKIKNKYRLVIEKIL